METNNDFSPEIRKQHWYSGDSRKAANGRANDVILEKLGIKPIEDLSDVEAVQMGHVMQPVIGRLAQEKLGIELKDADYAITHPQEIWLRSHFDFISADGKTLVEAKNYNAMVRNKFDSDANIIPAADMAQIIHEAACHNVDRVVLAVLFGGQNFETFDFTITPDMKEQLIKDMATYWAAVVAKEPLTPETTQQVKLLYPADKGSRVAANQQIERVASALKVIKANIKELEKKEEDFTLALQNHMQTGAELLSADGSILATWKSAKASKRFSADLFRTAMPDIYEKFVIEQAGSRRFLLK